MANYCCRYYNRIISYLNEVSKLEKATSITKFQVMKYIVIVTAPHESCGNLILKESLYQMFWASDQNCGHYFFNRQINMIRISINGILFLGIPQYEFLKMSHPCIVMRPTVIAQTVIAQIIADINSMKICQKASHL